MNETYKELAADIEKINRISIIPTILDVICETTGMGFAAVARVAKNHWIACSVRDDINFGLKPGGELKIETTICNEIRSHGTPVIIDHVKEDEKYCGHHTPAMYGFQSYISIPIVLKTGEFFGTLCAIDPQPALLNNPKTIGMFNLFSDLISYHLQSQELLDKSGSAVQTLHKQLMETAEENRQYHYISNHNLQEPLRKIRVLSSMLLSDPEHIRGTTTKEIAKKINNSAQRFSMMIKDLSYFSDLNDSQAAFEQTDLNVLITDVCRQLQSEIDSQDAVIVVGKLPVIRAIGAQIEQLFYQLISNGLKFSKKYDQCTVNVFAEIVPSDKLVDIIPEARSANYLKITVEDNGKGMETAELEKVFELFSQLTYMPDDGRFGIGLAYCRKIVRNHHGFFTVQSKLNEGTVISILLPAGLIISSD